ncbi:peptidoglycan DD-metalloendopeptidase family protein [Ornithinibacillus bavariensis]|uniref:Metalloendopeptidase n=1 Tax=Ornithinibacillus bavariensis TaxID=545502 RepID=A0A920C6S2_9BACI|nr:M23 family metallopeptidase [Ornithinibacillus bavariensis]GIO28241.1 metalloendopeptidase [Ornithinibacillus bavariensis]
MSFGKNKLYNPEPKKKPLLKKALISTGLVTILATGIVFAEESSNVRTVQHVYVNGEHIGLVSDASVVEEVIQSKLAKADKSYEDADLAIAENVKLVPELVFNPTYNNTTISNYLESNLTVKAKAVELKIGNDVVGYFDSKEAAEKVIEDYKLKYVDAETLAKVEAAKSTNKESDVPQNAEAPSKSADLAVGESTILDVTLSKDVSFSDKKVDPNTILTVADGLKLLEKGTLKEEKHTVKEGEVLGSIASKYNLSLASLLKLNPSIKEDTLIQIGQELNVTELKPFVDVIVKKEEKKEETIAFETEIKESKELLKGDEKVTQEGSDGEKVVHYTVEIRNGKVSDRKVLDEKTIKEPVNKVVVKGTKVIPSRGTGTFKWPTSGGYISSHVGYRWGAYHKGLDIAGPSNRTITAADNGTVVFAGYQGSYGNKIEINHNNGMKTVYAHLASINVSVGQTVQQGQQIGIMGSTGNSTGIHLHFEVYKNGALQNPLSYLK